MNEEFSKTIEDEFAETSTHITPICYDEACDHQESVFEHCTTSVGDKVKKHIKIKANGNNTKCSLQNDECIAISINDNCHYEEEVACISNNISANEATKTCKITRTTSPSLSYDSPTTVTLERSDHKNEASPTFLKPSCIDENQHHIQSSAELDLPNHSSLCGSLSVTASEIAEHELPSSEGQTYSNLNLHGEISGTVAFIGCSADSTLISIGTAEGDFFIFSSQTHTCLCHQTDCGGPVAIVEMLVCSSIVAIVVAAPLLSPMPDEPTAGSSIQKRHYGNRDVQLWNLQKGSRIAIVSFATEDNILSIPCFDLPQHDSAEPILSPTSRSCLASPREGHKTSLRHGSPKGSSGSRSYEAIVAVRLSHRRLVVFLDSPCAEIEVFELRKFQLIHRLQRNVVTLPGVLDTSSYCPSLFLTPLSSSLERKTEAVAFTLPSSLAGVCAMSVNPCLGFLAVPIAVAAVTVRGTSVSDECLVAATSTRHKYDNQTGSVVVLDLHDGASIVNTVEAHTHPLASMSCNGAATLLVTASVKGTILRIWTLPSLEIIWLWRRGSRPAKVVSMGFTWDSHYIWAASTYRTSWTLSADLRHQLSHSTALFLQGGVCELDTSIGDDSCPMQSPASISVHIFACAKILTALQRKKHTPPSFPKQCKNLSTSLSFPYDDATEENEYAEEEDVERSSKLENKKLKHRTTKKGFCQLSQQHSVLPNELIVIDDETTTTQTHQRMSLSSIVYTINNKKKKSPMINHINLSTLLATKVRERADRLATIAKTQLRNVMVEYIIPRLPNSVRETFIEAHKSFAIVKLRPFIGRLHTGVPIITIVVSENCYQKIIEISVFTSTGCALTYVCNSHDGGACELRSETPLLYPAETTLFH